MFWIANKVFAAHSIISALGLGWAMLISQMGLAVLIVLLWIGAFLLWSEWRNT